jgi:cell division protein ZapA
MPDKGPNSDSTGAARAISVDIYDQTYHLHGQDPEYVRRLAHIIDSKMRAVAAQGKTVDSLRVAVLAALNVADELVLAEEKYEALACTLNTTQGTLRTRAHSLTGLIDSVLDTGT